jgi:hypothetical protein
LDAGAVEGQGGGKRHCLYVSCLQRGVTIITGTARNIRLCDRPDHAEFRLLTL